MWAFPAFSWKSGQCHSAWEAAAAGNSCAEAVQLHSWLERVFMICPSKSFAAVREPFSSVYLEVPNKTLNQRLARTFQDTGRVYYRQQARCWTVLTCGKLRNVKGTLFQSPQNLRGDSQETGCSTSDQTTEIKTVIISVLLEDYHLIVESRFAPPDYPESYASQSLSSW